MDAFPTRTRVAFECATCHSLLTVCFLNQGSGNTAPVNLSCRVFVLRGSIRCFKHVHILLGTFPSSCPLRKGTAYAGHKQGAQNGMVCIRRVKSMARSLLQGHIIFDMSTQRASSTLKSRPSFHSYQCCISYRQDEENNSSAHQCLFTPRSHSSVPQYVAVYG